MDSITSSVEMAFDRVISVRIVMLDMKLTHLYMDVLIAFMGIQSLSLAQHQIIS